MSISDFNKIQKEIIVLQRDLTINEERKINRLYSRYIINSLSEDQVRLELNKIYKLMITKKL